MMVMPPIVLLGILVLWGIISFVAGMMVGGSAGTTSSAVVGLRVVNVGLGFFGILSVIAIPIFLIIGLIYILTGPKEVVPPPAPPSDTNMETPT